MWRFWIFVGILTALTIFSVAWMLIARWGKSLFKERGKVEENHEDWRDRYRL